jgi:hypothetical protein
MRAWAVLSQAGQRGSEPGQLVWYLTSTPPVLTRRSPGRALVPQDRFRCIISIKGRPAMHFIEVHANFTEGDPP